MTLSLRWSAPARPVEIRWRGPDLKPAALAQIASPSGLAAIVGPPGADASASRVVAVAASSLAVGMPASINRATGKMMLADAGVKSSAFVVGLVDVATASGFVAGAAVEQLVLADWTAATGAASLLAGQPYFLGAGGGMTTVPPGSPNCVVLLGKAINATTFLISPQPPIQL